MEVISTIAGAIIGLAVLAMVIGGFFMWIGAKIAGVKNSTFGRAIVAAIGSAFITWLISLVFSIVPVIGTTVGFILGLIFSIFVIQGAFGTSFGKALLVWIFHVIAEGAAVAIGAMTFAGAVLKMLQEAFG